MNETIRRQEETIGILQCRIAALDARIELLEKTLGLLCMERVTDLDLVPTPTTVIAPASKDAFKVFFAAFAPAYVNSVCEDVQRTAFLAQAAISKLQAKASNSKETQQ